MKYWPFMVVNDASRPKVQVEYKGETKSFYPLEVSSTVLTKMKEIVEAYMGKMITNAVLESLTPALRGEVVQENAPDKIRAREHRNQYNTESTKEKA
ncbi:hypothetical protein ACRRTK_001715 [Alexandromys fortis]